MVNFSSADDFYAQRDNRTVLYDESVTGYQLAKVLVITSPQRSDTYSGQLMALSVSNTLSRFCRNVTVIAPNVPLHRLLRDEKDILSEQILSVMKNADPFGSFTVTDKLAQVHDDIWDCVILIGPPSEKVNVDINVSIDASGWLACIGTGEVDFDLEFKENFNPVGPGMASALGVSEVFKIVTNREELDKYKRIILSGYDFCISDNVHGLSNPELPVNQDLGNCLMVGVGMVGSSMLYYLKKTNLQGELTLVDGDIVKVVNLNRSPIFGVKDCDNSKVEVGASYMNSSGFTTIPIHDYYNLNDLKKYDILLPLANEFGIRSVLLNEMPPISIHAAVTKGRGVNLYRHIPLKDCCIECYPINSTEKPSLLCSVNEIVTEKARIDAALPFLPVMAGALLTGEMIKLKYDNYPITDSNTLLIDLLGQPRIIQYKRPITDNECTCKQEVFKMIHKQFIKGSKYAHLSD